MSQPNPYQQYPAPLPQPRPASVPTYQTEVVVLLSLFCCFPLGLVFLWTSPRFSQNAKIGLSIVIGLFVVAAGVNGNNNRDRGSDEVTSNRRVKSSPPTTVALATTDVPTHAPVAPAAPPTPSALVVPAKTLMADYKANEIRADGTYKGRLVETKGIVRDVKRNILGNLYVTMGTGATFELPAVQCFCAEGSAPRAAQLNRGDAISVRGRVDGLMMNVLVRDAEFTN
jgi:hypothetical protein